MGVPWSAESAYGSAYEHIASMNYSIGALFGGHMSCMNMANLSPRLPGQQLSDESSFVVGAYATGVWGRQARVG